MSYGRRRRLTITTAIVEAHSGRIDTHRLRSLSGQLAVEQQNRSMGALDAHATTDDLRPLGSDARPTKGRTLLGVASFAVGAVSLATSGLFVVSGAEEIALSIAPWVGIVVVSSLVPIIGAALRDLRRDRHITRSGPR